MLNTNCAHCGFANQVAEEICVACGGNLTLRPSFDPQSQPHEWQPQADPDQLLPGIRPFGVDTVIGDTLSIFTKNLWLITRIVVVIVTPLQIFRALNLPETTDNFEVMTWSYLLGAAAEVLMAPALIYALMKVLETGRSPGVQESYRWGINKLIKLSICALVTGLLTALGYALCIIPGIIVMLSLSLVYPIAVLEGGSVAEILSESRDLTRGHRLQILGAWIVMGLIMVIPYLAIAFVIGSFAETTSSWPLAVVASIASDILGQLQTVMALVIYLGIPRNAIGGGHSVLSLK
ncbi:MAG TPA: hypothetical protein VN844_14130 [Pyrinomonadaceae bacterium]|nr:hypothetical protein [Pyrinomonadaceae bacterium]